jgi:ubiquinone/menaquinone biosynthesis C-methylase UbiE
MSNHTLGWGIKSTAGAEIWDTDPVFLGEQVEFKDWCKLLFYPKKWMLYQYLNKHLKHVIPVKTGILKNKKIPASAGMTSEKPMMWEVGGGAIRILDVGCGTGASLIDFKKMFGRSVEVCGVDVVALQIDLAKQKIKQNAVWAEVQYYDGKHLPFANEYFDVVYTSDVLGHVENVPEWLKELQRVLKPGGALSMFAESKLGKHAYIRNYLMKRGLNVDPHAEFHISLYSKTELQNLLTQAGFEIKKMLGMFWASFLVHPEEYAHKLQSTKHHLFLRLTNKLLCWLKKKLHPYSTALCELFGLMEMYLVGKWIEAQGYIILAKKK